MNHADPRDALRQLSGDRRVAMQWPYEWDPASIDADFSQMQDLGLNLARFDLGKTVLFDTGWDVQGWPKHCLERL